MGVDMNPSKTKPRVYQEQPKTRQTTHWDVDYLTRKEVDALYRVDTSPKRPDPPLSPRASDDRRLPLILIGSGLLLLVISLSLATLL